MHHKIEAFLMTKFADGLWGPWRSYVGTWLILRYYEDEHRDDEHLLLPTGALRAFARRHPDIVRASSAPGVPELVALLDAEAAGRAFEEICREHA